MDALAVPFSESEVARLMALVPWAASSSHDPAEQAHIAVAHLVTSEEHRRDGLDGLTAARTVQALRSGALLETKDARPYIDPPVDTLRVHAIAVDVRAFVQLNDWHGFGPADRALCRLASAILAQWPERILVRMHGDAFAAISWTTATTTVDRPALEAAFAAALRGTEPDALDPCPSRFTIAELELSLRRPHDRAVAGALVAAEIERALRFERLRPEGRAQTRDIDLDGG